MTEREAIEILSRPFSMREAPKEILDAHRLAISALEKQEQDRWHSVAKEGNPKESGFYLWTSKDGTVREDYYQARDDTWSKAWQFGYKVVAWKNEPEPYTEESNE